MNKNRISKKVAVVGLTMALAAGQTMSAFPCIASAADVSKQESVFVNLDASGETTAVTVSDWIKNVAIASSIKDKSELSDIINLKGEETFKQDGDSLIWDANKEDIYYQGKTERELPVSMDITYKLDGKEIEPNELVGKTGKVEMHIEYSNHAKKTITVKGKKEEISVPFAMITGVILPTEHFKNVEVDNGKIMSDADRDIVVGYALPGLEESLDLSKDLKDDIDIPNSITITADAKEFELGGTYTFATAEFMDDIDMSDMDTVDKLKDSMDDLKDASNKLVNGTEELADGVGTLQEKSGEFVTGIDSLSDGLTKLNTGAKNLEGGIETYTSGADKLAAGIKQLGKAIQTLPEKLTELVTGLTAAKEGAGQLVSSTEQLEQGMKSVNGGIDTVSTTLTQVSALLSTVDGAATDPKLQKAIGAINALAEETGAEGTLKGGATAVEAGLGQLKGGQKSLQDGLEKMQSGVAGVGSDKQETAALSTALEQLGAGADQLSQNSSSLVEGAKSLTTATDHLKKGGSKLDNGADALTDGISELKNGSTELRDGMKEFNTDGIMKLYNFVNDDIATMFDRLDEISKVGANYNSFTGIDENMDGTVRFIMQTEEIK